MPDNAPEAKTASVRRLGATISFCKPTIADREESADRIALATGATLIHPFNDVAVIAGQGTAAMELIYRVRDLDAIIAPVGGGGLIAGTCISAKHLRPQSIVIGAEPAQAADAWLAWVSSALSPVGAPPDTIADGLRTPLGANGFAVITQLLDNLVVVSEDAIVEAMRLIWEVLKIVIEPSAAVPVAALLEKKVNLAGMRTGIILSGGNVDLQRLPWQVD
jgi:threonine dehydratase